MRADHQAVENSKDAGVDPDANREGQDDHCREQRVAANEANAVAHVVQEGFEQQVRMAALLLHLFDPCLGQEAARRNQRLFKQRRLGRRRRRNWRLLRLARGLEIQRHYRGLRGLLVAECAITPCALALGPPSPPDGGLKSEQSHEGDGLTRTVEDQLAGRPQ